VNDVYVYLHHYDVIKGFVSNTLIIVVIWLIQVIRVILAPSEQ